ncbi:MAG: phosphate signaling complex protein PhoU [Syntrophobacteraceae bacterium]|nr:phosphate signaling complex protein PhoU [Desulfobacteraceae bacterium]
MDSRFQQEIEQLRLTLLHMAALAERSLSTAIRSFFERDVELARQVIAGDHEINLLEIDIDKRSLRLLALEQPMARDLRFIVGCMRISIDLERVGDQAVNIAQRAVFLSKRPPLPPLPAMEQLADTALDMLMSVIQALIHESIQEANDVCHMDDTADELNVTVLRNLLDYMVKEVPAVERAVETIIAARCLERAADQATNIAESVIFIVRGVNIKHGCEE